MKIKLGAIIIIGLAWLFSAATVIFATEDLAELLDDEDYVEDEMEVFDPFESTNRLVFSFNDKVFHGLALPVGRAYATVLPVDFRFGIDRIFVNLLAPVRIVNNLLQGKLTGTGVEISRFVLNSTFGVGGFADPGSDAFNLSACDEDYGQTLAVYGFPEGPFINLPFVGPYTARDTLGLVGDYFSDPMLLTLRGNMFTGVATYAGKSVNQVSINGERLNDLLAQSLDPYAAVRDFYLQGRRSRVADEVVEQPGPDSIIQVSPAYCQHKVDRLTFKNLLQAKRYQQCLRQEGVNSSLRRFWKRNRARFVVAVMEVEM